MLIPSCVVRADGWLDSPVGLLFIVTESFVNCNCPGGSGSNLGPARPAHNGKSYFRPLSGYTLLLWEDT